MAVSTHNVTLVNFSFQRRKRVMWSSADHEPLALAWTMVKLHTDGRKDAPAIVARDVFPFLYISSTTFGVFAVVGIKAIAAP